jgi:hypothetical protein
MQLLKKWNMSWIVLCAAAMLFAGCGGGGGSSAPAPTTGSVKFVNNATYNYWIDEAYVALSSSTTWGAQRNTSAIAPGSSWTLSGLTPGTYDAAIVSYGTVSTYYAYNGGFPITAGTTYTLTATDASYTGTLFVNNTSPTYPITAVYISTTPIVGGEPNQISTNVAPTTTREIVNIPSGTYYVRAVQNGVNRNNSGVSILSHGYITITYN